MAAGLQRSEGRDGTSRFSRRGRSSSSRRSSISQRGGGRDRGLRHQVVGFQRGEHLVEELLRLILRLRAAIPPVRCFPIVASAVNRTALLAAAAAVVAAGIGVGVRIAQGSEDAQILRGGVASLRSPGGRDGKVAVRGREGAERQAGREGAERVVGRHAPASERHQLRSRPLQELCGRRRGVRRRGDRAPDGMGGGDGGGGCSKLAINELLPPA
mmetsp:Transcript_2846/g.8984  ORF Transcript_2846/g.8984 Transcript_2846/m.8984 type:complete len:214 (+) Transcript_2846:2329-2970(+)